VAHTRPAVLPTWLRQIGVQAVAELGIDYRLVMSRGLRDTQVMNEIMPAGLVLVPSRGGLSHNPDEWTSPVDIARGSRVLAEWISRLDEQLTKWRQP
jgi:acetylornithine deacetylase/succinyl-diaminopimelate desuccinylase-like protein